MATIAAEWRILESAFDELNLWELPGRHVYRWSGGTGVSTDIRRDDIREALAEALRNGLVQLYDQADRDYPVFELDEALSLVSEESEWTAECARRRAALTITPAGEVASHAVFEKFRTASPFLALGIADPQVIDPEATDS